MGRALRNAYTSLHTIKGMARIAYEASKEKETVHQYKDAKCTLDQAAFRQQIARATSTSLGCFFIKNCYKTSAASGKCKCSWMPPQANSRRKVALPNFGGGMSYHPSVAYQECALLQLCWGINKLNRSRIDHSGHVEKAQLFHRSTRNCYSVQKQRMLHAMLWLPVS